jgi:hypothetical protein
MPFSVKAQEIHAHILKTNQTDYWVGVARRYIRRKRQYQPGPAYSRRLWSLTARLKAELAGAVPDASDSHWDEIANWFFELAIPK